MPVQQIPVMIIAFILCSIAIAQDGENVNADTMSDCLPANIEVLETVCGVEENGQPCLNGRTIRRLMFEAEKARSIAATSCKRSYNDDEMRTLFCCTSRQCRNRCQIDIDIDLDTVSDDTTTVTSHTEHQRHRHRRHN